MLVYTYSLWYLWIIFSVTFVITMPRVQINLLKNYFLAKFSKLIVKYFRILFAVKVCTVSVMQSCQ